tara:strand:+ start:65 stop:691 length:627 start_codon:yes stop_codon:yes gene_type:complete
MIVIDNFIKDKEYLKELNNKKYLLFKDSYQYESRWWNGWWKDKAKTIHQELIEYIVKDNQFIDDKLISRVKAFEYWTHVHSSKSGVKLGDIEIDNMYSLEWHQNKNESAYRKKKVLIHPMFSIIFWPVEQEVLEGGYLEMISDKISDDKCYADGSPKDCHSFENYQKSERIKPKHNRLVIMNPINWHRVKEVTDGTRWTFVFDGYDKY